MVRVHPQDRWTKLAKYQEFKTLAVASRLELLQESNFNSQINLSTMQQLWKQILIELSDNHVKRKLSIMDAIPTVKLSALKCANLKFKMHSPLNE